jgi:hypothetical protein
MRSVKGIWRGRLYFPMDSLLHAAFLVSLSKTVLMNGISVTLLNPLALMYEINPVAASSQTSVATNMVSMSSTNVFTADQCIATLEQEILYLRNAKRTFDGVEILKPTRANKPVPTEQPKVPESMTKSMPPLSQPAPAEKPVATTQPPIHPFTVKETSYQPPYECNFAATPPPKPAKDKQPAYHYVAFIQYLHTVINIYNKLMQAPFITLSPEELFAISPEVHNRLCEAIMPKQVLNKMVSTHALIEQVLDEVLSEEKTSITIPDVYETYINSLAPVERPIPSMLPKSCMLCGRLQWLLTTERRWKVLSIWDPRL